MIASDLPKLLPPLTQQQSTDLKKLFTKKIPTLDVSMHTLLLKKWRFVRMCGSYPLYHLMPHLRTPPDIDLRIKVEDPVQAANDFLGTIKPAKFVTVFTPIENFCIVKVPRSPFELVFFEKCSRTHLFSTDSIHFEIDLKELATTPTSVWKGSATQAFSDAEQGIFQVQQPETLNPFALFRVPEKMTKGFSPPVELLKQVQDGLAQVPRAHFVKQAKNVFGEHLAQDDPLEEFVFYLHLFLVTGRDVIPQKKPSDDKWIEWTLAAKGKLSPKRLETFLALYFFSADQVKGGFLRVPFGKTTLLLKAPPTLEELLAVSNVQQALPVLNKLGISEKRRLEIVAICLEQGWDVPVGDLEFAASKWDDLGKVKQCIDWQETPALLERYGTLLWKAGQKEEALPYLEQSGNRPLFYAKRKVWRDEEFDRLVEVNQFDRAYKLLQMIDPNQKKRTRLILKLFLKDARATLSIFAQEIVEKRIERNQEVFEAVFPFVKQLSKPCIEVWPEGPKQKLLKVLEPPKLPDLQSVKRPPPVAPKPQKSRVKKKATLQPDLFEKELEKYFSLETEQELKQGYPALLKAIETIRHLRLFVEKVLHHRGEKARIFNAIVLPVVLGKGELVLRNREMVFTYLNKVFEQLVAFPGKYDHVGAAAIARCVLAIQEFKGKCLPKEAPLTYLIFRQGGKQASISQIETYIKLLLEKGDSEEHYFEVRKTFHQEEEIFFRNKKAALKLYGQFFEWCLAKPERFGCLGLLNQHLFHPGEKGQIAFLPFQLFDMKRDIRTCLFERVFASLKKFPELMPHTLSILVTGMRERWYAYRQRLLFKMVEQIFPQFLEWSRESETNQKKGEKFILELCTFYYHQCRSHPDDRVKLMLSFLHRWFKVHTEGGEVNFVQFSINVDGKETLLFSKEIQHKTEQLL